MFLHQYPTLNFENEIEKRATARCKNALKRILQSPLSFILTKQQTIYNTTNHKH